MYKIFIVEDDASMAGSIAAHLEDWGFQAKTVSNFQKVIEEFVEWDPQLVLMDVSLPAFNGYHWCGEIRKVSKVPVIFISSASDNMNIVMAMNMGGDDFIAKPFDLNVLTAKIQAMLRRTYDFGGDTELIEHEGLILNMSDATAVYDGCKIDLSKNEYKILQVLMEKRGHIVGREELMTRLWESDSFIDDNTLTVNMTRLRKKLEAAGVKNYIRTKKGAGYIVE